MITIQAILKMMNRAPGHNASIPDSRIMHPLREWLTGLLGVIIGVVGGSVFAWSEYRSYSVSTNAEIVVSETVVPYKAALVDKALKTYLEKKAVYESLLGTTVAIEESVGVSSTTVSVVENEATTSPVEKIPIKEESVTNAAQSEESDVPDLAI